MQRSEVLLDSFQLLGNKRHFRPCLHNFPTDDNFTAHNFTVLSLPSLLIKISLQERLNCNQKGTVGIKPEQEG